MTDREKLRQLQETWRPPPEMERGRPRPARYTAAGFAAWMLAWLLAALGVALGAGIYVKATAGLERNRLLSVSTGRAEARIVRLSRRGSGGDARYLASYEFEAGARTYRRSARLSRAVWRTLESGGRREVRYVETNPEISRLEGLERPAAIPLWLAPLVGVILPAAAFFILRDLAAKRRLLEEGRTAAGMVTRLGRKTDKGRLVYYAFLTLGGSLAEGKFGPVRNRTAPEPGTPLTVLYDPNDPAFNRRYPLAAVTAGRAH
ncbi:MAG: DUF3592 domain-containing protein [Bryobacterales bacterium]|nr:DUF3592 domain-containing protein [Bryobacterales bacterium]